MGKNYYPEMIKSLDAGVSHSDIMKWLCAHRPHSIVEAVNALKTKPLPVRDTCDDPEWVQECRDLVRNEKNLSAAKLIIENSGISVKEGIEVAKRLLKNINHDLTSEPWWGSRRPVKKLVKEKETWDNI